MTAAAVGSLDAGISTEPAEVSFENSTYMEALQAGFKAYGVPFQIDGSVIRFDWGDEPIDRKFTYRPDRGMLSLKGDTDTSGMVPRQQGLCNAYSCKRDTRLLLVSR